MKRVGVRVEREFLTSRVARRVFLLVILCALIPVSVMAFISFFHVRSELRAHADKELHHATKMAGMTLLERLQFLNADLERLALAVELPGDVGQAVHNRLHGRSAERFADVHLLGPDHPTSGGQSPVDLRTLKDSQAVRLEQGSLLVTAGSGDSTAVAILYPITGSHYVLVAHIQAKYLWSGDGFLPAAADLLVLDNQHRLLFSTRPLPAALDQVRQSHGESSGTVLWSDDNQEYIGRYWTLFMMYDFGSEWVVLQSQERDIAFAALDDFSSIFLLVVLLTILCVFYVSLRQVRKQLVPISRLTDVTRRLSSQDFSERVRIDTDDEFGELGNSFNQMADSLEHYLEVVKTSNQIGTLLTAEEDSRVLLLTVLLGVRQVTGADGAAIYIFQDDGSSKLSLVEVESLKLTSTNPEDMPLHATSEALNPQHLEREGPVCIADVSTLADGDRPPVDNFEDRFSYRVRSLLTIPMLDHEKQVIGAVQIFNKREGSDAKSFSADDQRNIESLASQAAVTITRTRLINDFRQLFEALTNLIAVAIDEKSEYTGGHCQRVPIVTMMLAEAARKTRSGPMKDFDLTEEELYELKVAALLHDCGKVTTPVHVVDKGTKLETIFDRVELVATRFQVVKHQMELEHLRPEATEPALAAAPLASKFAQLEDDLHFVTLCNQGDESMHPEDQLRIREIAKRYQWTNSQGSRTPILSDEEVENLTVSRGTLNAEEREVINNHVVVTRRMLDSLPYPKHLRAVPQLAGQHHERLDGSGYPQGLEADRLSTRSRILAFADVFEALTAKDRPYKDGLKLSEVMRLLASMTQSGKLDRELLEIFIKEKVYLRYAEEYLDPKQIDQTDFRDFLRGNEDLHIPHETTRAGGAATNILAD